MVKRRYRVIVQLRPSKGGEVVEGTIEDDGLQSLWELTEDDGTTRWVSELDTFRERKPIVDKLTPTKPALMTVLRWCDVEREAHTGALTLVDNSAWWQCSSCDRQVDVTDEVRGAFRDI